jgi:hypothetical protein
MNRAVKGPETESSPSSRDWDEDEDIATDVSPLVVDAIGKALQAHFQAIADMPLPDRLLVLLAELEARERRQ